MADKIRLTWHQSPGDTVVGTAAVECLARQYPGQFLISVDGTAAREIFEANPHVCSDSEEAKPITMQYPLVHQSNQRPVHFIQGFVDYLADKLGVKLACEVNRPYLYLSEAELSWKPRIEEITGQRQKYWLLCLPGRKTDFTTKRWPVEWVQAVVDKLRGRINFIQVGEAGHEHIALNGVINELGKTDIRQLLRMAGHPLCQGALTGESLLHHVMAGFSKPCVTIASGFLPRSWVQYPTGVFLSRHGQLSCCKDQACWKSRVVPRGDGDEKDKSLCLNPVYGYSEPVPKCMAMISVDEVCAAIEGYYSGGLLSFQP